MNPRRILVFLLVVFALFGCRRSTVEIATYDDHRMAMAFALVGLVVPGVAVRDPGCVAKTFPGYFAALEQLR